MDGPGYIEAGYGHNALTGDNSDWNDFYLRGMVSGGRNVFSGELTHEDRFGDSGWFGGLGLTRTLSENWYAQFSAGAQRRWLFSAQVSHRRTHQPQVAPPPTTGSDRGSGF